MEELIKYATEGSFAGIAALLLYYLFKRFVKKEVIEPIEELQKNYKSVTDGFIKFTDRVTSFVFSIQKGHKQLEESMAQETLKMSNLFADAMRQVSEARVASMEAVQKSRAAMKVAEEQNQTTAKMFQIVKLVHNSSENMKTEIKHISEDLLMVKTKVADED